MASARSTSPCRGVSPTQSNGEKDGLNVMKCAVSTFVSHTWSARPDPLAGEQGGEHRGGTGPRVRCSPLAVSRPVASAASWRTGCNDSEGAKPLSRGWLRRSRTGGGFCRPRTAGSRGRRSQRQPWRERPRVCTARAAKPAASAWSLTPRQPVTVEFHLQRDPRVVTTAEMSLHSAPILRRSVPWNQRAMCSR